VERLKVTIEAESPLCFSERRPAGQFRESTCYIPGSVLRAAAAELMLRDGWEGSAEFETFFVGERPAVFRNAYPAPRVFPATAASCKAVSGLRSEGKHGVIDTLVEQLCFEALKPAGFLYMPTCNFGVGNAKKCGERMERYSGFYFGASNALRSRSVSHRLLRRVAINRRRGVAEDELLYAPIVIEEGRCDSDGNYESATFVATLTVPKHGSLVKQYLERVRHLGSSTSRGLGRVRLKVEIEPVEQDKHLESIRRRREDLNRAIKDSWDRLKALPGWEEPEHDPDKGAYFTIDLYADTILKEDGWLPAVVLDRRMLQEWCGVSDDSLRLVRAYSGYDYRGGWNVAWGLPKEVDVVVPRGSVFLFWTQSPELWDQALIDLELWGVGERTAEGFGQVRVCDEFHLIARRDNPA